MTTLTVLVGLPASGKSSWAREHAQNNEAVIVSSDSVRAEKYGAEEIQGDNNALFNEIHTTIASLLNEGTNVFFDATSISNKHRIELLKKMPAFVYKKAVVFATPYHKCLEWNSCRTRIVPENVIERMWKSFTMPQYNEGFDNIEIVYPAGYDSIHYTIEEYLKEADVFEQDNYHHEHTLGIHSRKVASVCASNSCDVKIYVAGLLHDCGKPYCKEFKTFKGEPSEIAHYFGHESVGAYEAMFYLKELNYSFEEIVWIVGLIQYHMRLYFCNSEKSKNKLINLIGEKMYNSLLILHMADKASK